MIIRIPALFIFLLSLVPSAILCQDIFRLKSELVGHHPRILFTGTEAAERSSLAKQHMAEEWNEFVSRCTNMEYPNDRSILGQRQWWYFSMLGIGIAMINEPSLIDKGKLWLNNCFNEKWNFDAGKTVDLDIAHKLAGFALLYDCMYNYLSLDERNAYEGLLKTGFIKFRTHGFDIGDYWTNDYQNNHLHFRATASLFCAAILIDKYPDLQAEADSVIKVWRRIAYMSPHDGSNHEGLNYSNYGGQMLYPGIYALRHCTGMDITTSDHYRNVGYYYLYHTVPGFVSGFGFGDAENAAAASGPNYLFQIASFTRDPYIQYLAHKLKEKHPKNFYLPQWYILFNDPFLEKKDPSDLPLYRYFNDIGIVICRSSWKEDATAVAFKCGPPGGKLMNETRGTEYSHFTDYVNVAHDDPDAGTFLLFSKGDFLTTGDGYEKKSKVTTQHSTFIVDDLTQYGGGGAWSQPEEDQGRYAWQKDFAAVNDRVIFTGDMKGVYPDMKKLTRTFVSHQAKYILVYDDVSSIRQGRTFEWRLQTKGTLTPAGEKTFLVNKGSAHALVKLIYPDEADWSVGKNKIGNILTARLNNQKDNTYLVALFPDGAENTIIDEFNTASAVGIKIPDGENDEYTFFQKKDNVNASARNIKFNGNTLLLVENRAGKNLLAASLVNGNFLSVNSITFFSSDTRMNFGIEKISGDRSEMIFKTGPSSATPDRDQTIIIIGGLSRKSNYYLTIEGTTKNAELKTDRKGQTEIIIDCRKEYQYRIHK